MIEKRQNWTEDEYRAFGGESEALGLGVDEVEELRKAYAAERCKEHRLTLQKERELITEARQKSMLAHFFKIRLRRSNAVYNAPETPKGFFNDFDRADDAWLLVNYLHFTIKEDAKKLIYKDLVGLIREIKKFSHRDRARLLMYIVSEQFVEQLSVEDSMSLASSVFSDSTYLMEDVLIKAPFGESEAPALVTGKYPGEDESG